MPSRVTVIPNESEDIERLIVIQNGIRDILKWFGNTVVPLNTGDR